MKKQNTITVLLNKLSSQIQDPKKDKVWAEWLACYPRSMEDCNEIINNDKIKDPYYKFRALVLIIVPIYWCTPYFKNKGSNLDYKNISTAIDFSKLSVEINVFTSEILTAVLEELNKRKSASLPIKFKGVLLREEMRQLFENQKFFDKMESKESMIGLNKIHKKEYESYYSGIYLRILFYHKLAGQLLSHYKNNAPLIRQLAFLSKPIFVTNDLKDRIHFGESFDYLYNFIQTIGNLSVIKKVLRGIYSLYKTETNLEKVKYLLFTYAKYICKVDSLRLTLSEKKKLYNEEVKFMLENLPSIIWINDRESFIFDFGFKDASFSGNSHVSNILLLKKDLLVKLLRKIVTYKKLYITDVNFETAKQILKRVDEPKIVECFKVAIETYQQKEQKKRNKEKQEKQTEVFKEEKLQRKNIELKTAMSL